MGRRVNTAVWFEKYKRWQIKVQKDGERRTFTSSTPGRVGQRECNAKADAWADGNLVSTDIRTQKLFDNWLAELKLTTSRSNWRPYEAHWNTWIKSTIGKMKIVDVTEQHLQTVINKAYSKGRSKKYLKNIRSCMAAFIKYCRKCKTTSLIVESVSIPRGAIEGERIILQPEDVVTLLTNDTTIFNCKEVHEPFINAFRFEVTTGLRPGEIINLKWRDIVDDKFANTTGSINWDDEITRGKNDNAIRSFALKPIDVDILKKQRAWMLATGVRSDYIFSTSSGEHIKQCTYYRRWRIYRDYHNMAKASPYELRHTFVSMVKELPEGLIKPLVGHSVNMGTYSTYAH